ncbi:hypothetical protein J4E85_008550 [Alternaria conjuncta]|uniref:uncharacterized protein n=1 Tax=Alternaria conjuncta TaxID=181017 RepID=UPI0022210B38|nr:uncharacterized protein J4E85_008550 [Alternaria conjuncta]KAI4923511.1 hypothetical protein J4E85_008550 [Alternaria conjuncta]
MANGLAEELAELVDRAQDLMDQAGQSSNFRTLLDAKRLATLQRLYDQCTECEDVQEKELSPLLKKRKHVPEVLLGGPRDPWKRITNLEHLPEVPEYVNAHIRKHPGNAEDEKFLGILSLTSNCGQYNSTNDLGNAFMARYSWTQQVERRDDKIHILQLFNDLFWFDIMQLLRPRGTGRVGAIMRDELDKFLTPLDFDQMKLQKEEVMENVGDWSIRGSKINKLCSRYGPGVIIVLHRQLSRSFLEGKFTASGPYFEGAIHRLDDLKLHNYLENTNTGSLGISIRQLLIRPFQEAFWQSERARNAV